MMASQLRHNLYCFHEKDEKNRIYADFHCGNILHSQETTK